VAFLKDRQEPRGNWAYRYNQDHALGITALAGLALMENGVEASDPVIGKAAEVVTVLAKRSDQTYDISLAILFLARVQKGQTGPNDKLIRRLATRLAGGESGGMWTYTVPLTDEEDGATTQPSNRRRSRSRPREGDNSNTQFALLGLWAAGRHGFDPNESLRAIDSHFRGDAE